MEMIKMNYKSVITLSPIKNKSTIAVALTLLLAISMVGAIIPTVLAQEKWTSWAFVTAIPKDPQVNTMVLITGWTSPVPGSGTSPGDEESRFKQNYLLTITRPDGSVETKDPLKGLPASSQYGGERSYQDGSFFATYTPTQTGVYKVVFTWAGDDNYLPSTSETVEFVAGTEPGLGPAPDVPVPTYYWTRPLPGDIRGPGADGTLSNWFSGLYDAADSAYNPVAKAPETAHALWSFQSWAGGVIGGDPWGDFSSADAYTKGKNTGAIVMGGIVYDNVPRTNVYRAIDASTGEVLWTKEFAGSVTFATQPYKDETVGYDRGIQYMIYEVLPGQVNFYDGLTANAFNGGSFFGSSVTDPNVGIRVIHKGFAYYTGGGYLLKWHPNVPGNDLNSTNQWFTTKAIMNKTQYRVPTAGYVAPSLFWEDIGIGTSNSHQTAWNLTTGEVMWDVKDKVDNIAGQELPRGQPNDSWHEGADTVGDGLYFYQASVLRRTVAISLYTGEVVWWSEPRTYPYGAFTSYQMGTGQGKVYTVGYDRVWAYNTNDGTTAWSFYAGDTGETPYGTWSWWSGVAIADGKVYATNGEHSATNPQHKGNRMFCIDDSNGQEIWSIAGAWAGKSIADSKLFAYNENTGRLIAFGRGPSQTTIATSSSMVSKGSSVLIMGSVLDQSPMLKDTPCVAEESMTAQMEYLVMDRPKPTDSVGVPVQIWVTGPDGSTSSVGSALTDIYGNYAFEWTPPDNGIYRVSAYFAGDKSYFPSDAGTVFTVAEGPSASVSPSPTVSGSPTTVPTEGPGAPSPSEIYLIAVLAVVAIVVVAIAVALIRRRK